MQAYICITGRPEEGTVTDIYICIYIHIYIYLFIYIHTIYTITRPEETVTDITDTI